MPKLIESGEHQKEYELPNPEEVVLPFTSGETGRQRIPRTPCARITYEEAARRYRKGMETAFLAFSGKTRSGAIGEPIDGSAENPRAGTKIKFRPVGDGIHVWAERPVRGSYRREEISLSITPDSISVSRKIVGTGPTDICREENSFRKGELPTANFYSPTGGGLVPIDIDGHVTSADSVLAIGWICGTLEKIARSAVAG